MFNPLATVAKRALLMLHDGAWLAAIAIVCSAGLPAYAYAYVDPSVMTYTIQAIAGVAVALSAVLGVAFRRSRKAVFKLLNIDENRHKLVEHDIKRVPADTENMYRDVSEFVRGPMAEDLEPGKRTTSRAGGYARRFVLALVMALFASITLQVMAPYELLAGNASVLKFGLGELWVPLMFIALATSVVLALIVAALPKTPFTVVITLLFSFALGCYLQALVLNGALPTTDGRPAHWDEYQMTAIISTVVWIALFAIPLVGQKLNRRIATAAITVVAVGLIVVQGIAAGSLVATHSQDPATEDYVPASYYTQTEDGMFDLSPKKNVIVFVLDAFDTYDMEQLLEQYPALAEDFGDFTWFRNSVGAMSPTRYGAVFLWTGQYPSQDEPFEQYITSRFTNSPFLSDLEAADYSIGLYTDPMGDYALSDEQRIDLIYNKTRNIKAVPASEKPSLATPRMYATLMQCAAYRDFPGPIKQFFLFETNDINLAMLDAYGDDADGSRPYVIDDAQWYERLQKHGITLNDTECEGAYRLIHLMGAHYPYKLNADGTASGGRTDLKTQTRGSLEMVMGYLDEMKRQGVYDDAEIIITADHGTWWELEPGYLPWNTSPLMLVKPAGASGDELTVSQNSITAYDVLPTVIDYATGDASEYGPTLFEQTDPDRDRRFFYTFTKNNVDLEIVEFSIVGDVLDGDNWTRTGWVIDPSNTPRS